MQAPLICAEIDLNAIARNVAELRRITRPEAQLMIAVKANGYGHGIVETARAALSGGASSLGVARIEEALQLRRAGVTAPILVFGYTPESYADQLADHDLWASVFSLDSARRLAHALNENQHITIHIKVDTGMGRMGLRPDALRADTAGQGTSGLGAVEEILQIGKLDRLRVQGIWTHLAASDVADNPTPDFNSTISSSWWTKCMPPV